MRIGPGLLAAKREEAAKSKCALADKGKSAEAYSTSSGK
jgi:hypothetical protein